MKDDTPILDPFIAQLRARSRWERKRTKGGVIRCWLCERRPPTEGEVCEPCLRAWSEWEAPSLLSLYMSLPDAYEPTVRALYPKLSLRRALRQLAQDEGWGICECGALAAMNRRHHHYGKLTLLARGADEGLLAPLPPVVEEE